MKNNFDQLTFNVSYEQHPKEEISLIGFLFLCDGLLLDKQFVREGVLEFKNANYQTGEVRLFISPAMDKKIEKVSSIEELAAYKPYEPVLRAEAEGRISILPIPASISNFWPLCFCRVTGKVSKWFHVGYTWQDRAVC